MKSEISNVKLSEAARKVLDHFGLEDRDYEALGPYVDWESLVGYLENPTNIAVCHILDKKGEVVMRKFEPATGKPDEPVIVYEEVTVETMEEELDKKHLEFVEWWD